jgi:hypothetical protein
MSPKWQCWRSRVALQLCQLWHDLIRASLGDGGLQSCSDSHRPRALIQSWPRLSGRPSSGSGRHLSTVRHRRAYTPGHGALEAATAPFTRLPLPIFVSVALCACRSGGAEVHRRRELGEPVCHHRRATARFIFPSAPQHPPLPSPPSRRVKRAVVRPH